MMIETCLIFLASFTPGGLATDKVLATEPTPEVIGVIKECNDNMPSAMIEHVPHFIMFFEPENRYTAMRISWCESRGKTSAYRDEDSDSGLMQFIPRTWNWVHEVYGVPEWDTWLIMRFGIPHLETNTVYRTDYGFSQERVQHSPYWNIKAAAHLAEDMYGYTTWTDWSSSQWCWEDEKKWEREWRRQENW